MTTLRITHGFRIVAADFTHVHAAFRSTHSNQLVVERVTPGSRMIPARLRSGESSAHLTHGCRMDDARRPHRSARSARGAAIARRRRLQTAPLMHERRADFETALVPGSCGVGSRRGIG